MENGEEDRAAIRAELKRRIKLVNFDLEHTDRRDPYRQDLYADRRSLREALATLDDEEAWHTRAEVLQKILPEEYGGW